MYIHNHKKDFLPITSLKSNAWIHAVFSQTCCARACTAQVDGRQGEQPAPPPSDTLPPPPPTHARAHTVTLLVPQELHPFVPGPASPPVRDVYEDRSKVSC